MFLQLFIPKTVLVRNTRLNLLYMLMVVVTVVTYVIYFILAHKYAKKVNLEDNMHISVYPIGLNDVISLDRSFNRSAATLCRVDASLCVRACTTPGDSNCKRGLDLVQFEGANTLFFATQLQEQSASGFNQFFLPYEDAFAVNFDFSFTRPDTNFFSNHISWEMGTLSSSVKDIQTVLLKDGSIQRTIQPDGKPIHLTLKDILELASARGTFSDVLHRARKDGIEININVECFNNNHIRQEQVSRVLSRKYYTCQLNAELTPKTSAFRLIGPITDYHKVYHGIRLTFRNRGSWERIYWGRILEGIVDLVVMMSVPTATVKFIATKLLGPLSAVYHKMINERFGIRERLGGMATRLMADRVAYLHLIDSESSSGALGISPQHMHEQLKSCLQWNSELRPCELQQLTKFCFESVHLYSKKGEPDLLASVTKRSLKNDTADLILEDHFGLAITNNESVGFSDFAKLFSSTRKRGLLENVFTPGYLRRPHFAQITTEEEEQQEVAVSECGLSSQKKRSWVDMLNSLDSVAESDQQTECAAACAQVGATQAKKPFNGPLQADCTAAGASTLFKSTSTGSDRYLNLETMNIVREMYKRSAKAAEAVLEMQQQLKSIQDRSEQQLKNMQERIDHLKQDTKEEMRRHSEQLMHQLDSLDCQIKDLQFRADNELDVQKRTVVHQTEILRTKVSKEKQGLTCGLHVDHANVSYDLQVERWPDCDPNYPQELHKTSMARITRRQRDSDLKEAERLKTEGRRGPLEQEVTMQLSNATTCQSICKHHMFVSDANDH